MRAARDGTVRALALGLWLLATSMPAHAAWTRDYDLGVRAIEQGEWADAERHMRAAMADDAEPSARRRFQGQRFDRYVPHFYAGLAAYRQGDCARALDYWNNAANRQVVGGIAELAAEQNRLGAECRTQLAAGSVPAAVEDAVAAAPARDRAAPAATDASAPAQRTPPVTRPASPPAQPAARPREVVAQQPPPAPPRERPPARVAPPAALRTALDTYLAGRYAQLAQVEPAAALDGRARAQLLLLRAAARFLQAELSGNDSGLAAARQDVRAALRSGTPDLDAALYPPRFRAFVAATR